MEHMFILTGTMPILFHADDVEAADHLMAWRKAPANKGVSVAGDDRSPPWTWQTYVYRDEHGDVAIPQECLMACLAKAGAMIPAKGKSTFKSASQSGLLIGREHCEFRTGGKAIPFAKIADLADLTFAEQAQAVKKLGFELKVKRATVGSAKHVRVRAMFREWTVSGSIDVTDPTITTAVLSEMFDLAGRKVGLLDWRPSAPKKPGPYGTFTSKVWPIEGKRKSA